MLNMVVKRRDNKEHSNISEASGHSTDMFDVAAIAELPHMTNEQLKDLETKVQKEFKGITREYLNARLVRINSMIENLDNHIKDFRDNSETWNDDYESVLKRIHDIRFIQEELCLNDTQVDYNAYDISKMFTDFVSPFEHDSYLNHLEPQPLPFDKSFQKIIYKFVKDLTGLLNEQKRHIKLIQDKIKDNKRIIWLRYRANLLDTKNELLNSHLKELSMLNEMEQKIIRNEPISDAKSLIDDWNSYHNSLIPPGAKFPKDNTRYYISNKRVLKNKIETTNIKQNNLNSLKRFNESQYVPDINPGKRTRLLNCSGLAKDEIDQDLLLLKLKPKLNSQKEINEANDNNDDVAEVDDPVTPRSDSLQQDYSKLLEVMSKNDLNLPEIPAIENFPQLH